MERDNVAHELEIDGVTLQNLGITLLEFLLNVTRSHPMEAEVLQDVAEEVVRNGVLTLLKIVIEALLQVGGHLGRQVAYGRLIRRLSNDLLLLVWLVLLLRCHCLFQLL